MYEVQETAGRVVRVVATVNVFSEVAKQDSYICIILWLQRGGLPTVITAS